MNNYTELNRKLFITGIAVLFIGLVSSKALISIGSVILILSGLLSSWNQKKFEADKQVIGFSLLFIAPLISGIWSDSFRDWTQVISNKIMLPAIFWGVWVSPRLTLKTYLSLGLFQLILVVFATFYSIGPLFFQAQDISHSYLQAKTLQVLLSNDHLHFSLYVFISLIILFFSLGEIKREFGSKVYFLNILMGIWLIVYLHILGAKTGLIFLYLSILYYLVRTSVKQTRWALLSLGLVATITIALTAIKTIPTLQNRVHYTLYDFNQYIHGAYIDGLTDGARVLSWKAGMKIANQQPYTGVGFGDMNLVFTEWHKVNSAHLQSYNWLQPSNEWLMYLCGAGIPGIICLTIGLWLIYYYSPCRGTLLFTVLFFSQFFMMWYEVNLTNQTGIALFAFFIAWIQVRNPVHSVTA